MRILCFFDFGHRGTACDLIESVLTAMLSKTSSRSSTDWMKLYPWKANMRCGQNPIGRGAVVLSWLQEFIQRTDWP